jgi:tRNA threonylcarbamoyladenosine biosynthesis protein TsaE
MSEVPPVRPPAHPPAEVAEVALADEAATAALASRLAGAIGPGAIVWLSGDLGVGKTTLVRGVLTTLGHTGRVRSPTFTLHEPYNLPRFVVHHFDFYRFSSPDEWRDAGFDECFRSDAACLVEWPERAGPDLPAPDLWIRLRFAGDPEAAGEGGRIARIEARGDAGRRWLSALADASWASPPARC